MLHELGHQGRGLGFAPATTSYLVQQLGSAHSSGMQTMLTDTHSRSCKRSSRYHTTLLRPARPLSRRRKQHSMNPTTSYRMHSKEPHPPSRGAASGHAVARAVANSYACHCAAAAAAACAAPSDAASMRVDSPSAGTPAVEPSVAAAPGRASATDSAAAVPVCRYASRSSQSGRSMQSARA